MSAGLLITAKFDWSGPLNFFNNTAQNGTSNGDLNSAFGFTAANISSYQPGGILGAPANADFTSVTAFLNSSGSAGAAPGGPFAYGSFYTIELGVLDVGTVLTITHDDGASVFQNGVMIGTTFSGPTTVRTESVTLTSTAPTILYYGRQNGTPSILQVQVTPAPEPTTLSLIGLGLLGLGAMARRRRKLGR